MCVCARDVVEARDTLDTLRMFIDKLHLDLPQDGSLETEDKYKAAFRSIYSKVDGDRNGKVNFTEFAIWIIKSITGFDEFFKSFVSAKARSEQPPLYANTSRMHSNRSILGSHVTDRYLEDKVADTDPRSPSKHRSTGRSNSVSSIQIKTATKGATAIKPGASNGPLSPRHLKRQESVVDKVCYRLIPLTCCLMPSAGSCSRGQFEDLRRQTRQIRPKEPRAP
jgi:hypothetical protein